MIISISLPAIATTNVCGKALELTEVQRATLAVYDQTAAHYIATTMNMSLEEIDRFLPHVPPGGLILDAGSGSGRHSIAFLQRGYRVQAIDGSAKLAELASVRIGQQVRVQLFENIEEIETYDGVFAYFSLIHLPHDHLADVLKRLYRSLKPGAVLYMRMSYGEKDFTKDGRYFNAFTAESLRSFVKQHTSFEIVEISRPEANLKDGTPAYSVEAILNKLPGTL